MGLDLIHKQPTFHAWLPTSLLFFTFLSPLIMECMLNTITTCMLNIIGGLGLTVMAVSRFV